MIADELLECFDDKEKVIEPKLRGELHTKPYSTWHGVCNVWIVNIKGELLCSKRADFVSGNPGKWQTYFGGHVKAGSNFLQTAVAELSEEIGLNISPDNLHLIEKGRDSEYKHIFNNYTYLFNGTLDDLHFQDGEVTEVKWYLFEEYYQDKMSHPDKWCNEIEPEQYEALRRLISKRP